MAKLARDPNLSLTSPLIQDAAIRSSARSSARFLALAYLLIGVVFALLLTSVPCNILGGVRNFAPRLPAMSLAAVVRPPSTIDALFNTAYGLVSVPLTKQAFRHKRLRASIFHRVNAAMDAAVADASLGDTSISDGLSGPPLKATRPLSRAADLAALSSLLPTRIKHVLASEDSITCLTEIIMNLGQPPQARYRNLRAKAPCDVERQLDPKPVTADDLTHFLLAQALTPWTTGNRAGVKGTLHRVSRNVNPHTGAALGLFIRVGYPQIGAVECLDDLLRKGRSILLLGPPGVGKTTVLRETSRVLNDLYQKRTVIIDTSNEIAGGGDVPHWSVGRLVTRVMVSSREHQHVAMLEAVCNLNPEVIIIDEIGSKEDALAAASIAMRGVMIIATCHGNELKDLLDNPELNILAGGVEAITLGDLTAKLYTDGRKLQLQRKHTPVFDSLVELSYVHDEWVVHDDLRESVDKVLLNQAPTTVYRVSDADVAADHEISDPHPGLGTPADTTSDGEHLIPLKLRVSDTFCNVAEEGGAYVLTFDGGFTPPNRPNMSGSSGAGAVFARIRAGPMRVNSLVLPCIRKHAQTWRLFLVGESTPEQIEYGGLILGLQNVLDNWASYKPTPRSVLIQGDSKFVIQQVKANLTSIGAQAPASGSMWDTAELGTLRQAAVRLLKQIPVPVELIWLPRRFNKFADRVAQDARDKRHSDCQISPHLLQHLLAPGANVPLEVGRKDLAGKHRETSIKVNEEERQVAMMNPSATDDTRLEKTNQRAQTFLAAGHATQANAQAVSWVLTAADKYCSTSNEKRLATTVESVAECQQLVQGDSACGSTMYTNGNNHCWCLFPGETCVMVDSTGGNNVYTLQQAWKPQGKNHSTEEVVSASHNSLPNRLTTVTQTPQDLNLGDVVEGTVRSLQPYGIFVVIAKQATYAFKQGETLGLSLSEDGFVRNVVDGGQAGEKGVKRGDRILKQGDAAFSLVALNRLERAGSDYTVTFQVGSRQALLHISEISKERNIDIADVGLSPGDRIKALVISNDAETLRVGLSTKHLEQNVGEMLRNPAAVFEAAEEMGQVFRNKVVAPQLVSELQEYGFLRSYLQDEEWTIAEMRRLLRDSITAEVFIRETFGGNVSAALEYFIATGEYAEMLAPQLQKEAQKRGMTFKGKSMEEMGRSLRERIAEEKRFNEQFAGNMSAALEHFLATGEFAAMLEPLLRKEVQMRGLSRNGNTSEEIGQILRDSIAEEKSFSNRFAGNTSAALEHFVATGEYAAMLAPQLRRELEKRGLSSDGKTAEDIGRLLRATIAEEDLFREKFGGNMSALWKHFLDTGEFANVLAPQLYEELEKRNMRGRSLTAEEMGRSLREAIAEENLVRERFGGNMSAALEHVLETNEYVEVLAPQLRKELQNRNMVLPQHDPATCTRAWAQECCELLREKISEECLFRDMFRGDILAAIEHYLATGEFEEVLKTQLRAELANRSMPYKTKTGKGLKKTVEETVEEMSRSLQGVLAQENSFHERFGGNMLAALDHVLGTGEYLDLLERQVEHEYERRGISPQKNKKAVHQKRYAR